MLYIRKHRTPKKVKDKALEIINTPDSGYKDIVLPRDTQKLRNLFDQMPKAEIRKALYLEQHGLCAYCMRRIAPESCPGSDSMKIEHYKALSEDKDNAMDYQNYLGVCYGGEHDNKEKPYILCCDAARKEKPLTINPWDKRQMEAIAYQRNGEIFVRKDKGLDSNLVHKMQRDLDEVLLLNGKRDKEGKFLHDTASRLVANRKKIYESTRSQFERWDQKKCLTEEFLKDKIALVEKQFEDGQIADPYIGVRLYFYKRRYSRMKK